MLKRQFQSLYPENQQTGYSPGDEAAHRAAAALADRADAPTIALLTDAVTLLERVGGQFHLTALRVENADTDEWDTLGIGFNYETRDARIKAAKSPEDIGGVPITDAEGPAPEVELPEDPAPEIEAEELPDPEPALTD